MKLLFCTFCQDVFKLAIEVTRSCECGRVSGAYDADRTNAWYIGDAAVPLGFANGSLSTAIRGQPKTGLGREFTAFVIAKECPTFRLLKAAPEPVPSAA